MLAPDRLEALHRFAANALGTADVAIERASADASFRSYWRVRAARELGRAQARTYIAMNCPPALEDLAPWLDVGRRLQGGGIHVPEVLAADAVQGFVLMEDLGARLYLDALDANSADALYADALDALFAMQTKVDSAGLPGYDEPRLMTELEIFPEWFLGRHLGVQPGCEEWDVVESAFRLLLNGALEQPRTFVHRDYHSRNLLVVDARNPGVVDYQGALVGPITYDLVSLLRDCYIAWPQRRVHEWTEAYRRRLVEAGLTDADTLRFRRWFDWMGLQRHIKVLGIFCRLWYRDGKAGYLNDLPLVLKYTLDVAGEYEELAPFARWLREKVGSRDITAPRDLPT